MGSIGAKVPIKGYGHKNYFIFARRSHSGQNRLVVEGKRLFLEIAGS